MGVAVAPNITVRAYRWTAWKVIVASKGIVRWQHDDDGTMYTIWGYDGPEAHMCSIWKGVVPDPVATTQGYPQNQNDADKADFEANYLPTSNQSLEPKNVDGVPQVNVITDFTNPITVIAVPGTTPEHATNAIKMVDSSLGNKAIVDTYYTITNAKTLKLQMFEAATDIFNGGPGCSVELFYDPLAQTPSGSNRGPNWELIDVVFLEAGSNNCVKTPVGTYTGNGTKRIVVRRSNGSGNANRIFARWRGYEE